MRNHRTTLLKLRVTATIMALMAAALPVAAARARALDRTPVGNTMNPAQGAEQTALSDANALVYAPGNGRAGAGTVVLEPGPHLFLDDFLIASSENISRVVNVPQRDPGIPNPIVTGKEDGCFQPYMTVVRDSVTGRFRMWYGHRAEANETTTQHVGHMESADGIHWERPARVLADPAPMQFGVSIIDEGASCPDVAARYKLGWWKDGGLRIASSPDGFAWTPMTPNVVLYQNHDITGIFRDPLRGRYVATVSVYRKGEWWSGDRRVTMQSFSPDLLTWSPPHYVLLPRDGEDAGETQFYAMDGYLVRGGVTIGMVKVLRDDLKADTPPDPPEAYGVGYTALAWTRDGTTWTRDRAHFFDPDPVKGAWDHAHAWIDEQVPVGNDVHLYYGGYARGHKVNRFEERQIGLVRIQRDRYVARAADAAGGRFVTPPVEIRGRELTLNADASSGSVTVQLLDVAGRAIPGFNAEVHGDGVALPVHWPEPLGALKGAPVHMAFELKDARVFSFDVH